MCDCRFCKSALAKYIYGYHLTTLEVARKISTSAMSSLTNRLGPQAAAVEGSFAENKRNKLPTKIAQCRRQLAGMALDGNGIDADDILRSTVIAVPVAGPGIVGDDEDYRRLNDFLKKIIGDYASRLSNEKGSRQAASSSSSSVAAPQAAVATLASAVPVTRQVMTKKTAVSAKEKTSRATELDKRLDDDHFLSHLARLAANHDFDIAEHSTRRHNFLFVSDHRDCLKSYLRFCKGEPVLLRVRIAAFAHSEDIDEFRAVKTPEDIPAGLIEFSLDAVALSEAYQGSPHTQQEKISAFEVLGTWQPLTAIPMASSSTPSGPTSSSSASVKKD